MTRFLRLPFHSAKPGRGVTLIEILIAMVISIIFFSAIYFLYISSMQSFRITDWKQRKTTQAQLFWSLLRIPLEEANAEIVVTHSAGNLKLEKVDRPMKFKESVSGATTAQINVLEWKVDHFDPLLETVDTTTYKLYAKEKRLFLTGGRFSNKLVMEDVDEIKTKGVKIFQRDKSGNFEEYIPDTVAAPTDEEIGAIIEMTIVLKPPVGLGPKGLKLIQSCKFRVETTAGP